MPPARSGRHAQPPVAGSQPPPLLARPGRDGEPSRTRRSRGPHRTPKGWRPSETVEQDAVLRGLMCLIMAPALRDCLRDVLLDARWTRAVDRPAEGERRPAEIDRLPPAVHGLVHTPGLREQAAEPFQALDESRELGSAHCGADQLHASSPPGQPLHVTDSPYIPRG
ncbi:hypothetical protein SBRY_60486 [Actinacidiphila bryophytorum]|uniref:Uncharacterized protein n=1 Tax=Actinacidiphila bryophytorum TaxID=1436133 RepID=A0A9W4MGN0_9ACTN|nr:hypothetical protein SBRY_60486 [Actinacidiphila bryophytorum]